MTAQKRAFWIFSLLLVFAIGCDKLADFGGISSSSSESSEQSIPQVTGTVIARVNSFPITLEELNQEVEAFNSMVPPEQAEAKVTTREQKLSYLKEQMVQALLLYQAALDRRLDENEEIARILDKTKRELLVVELLRQEAERLEVTSQEVEDYYNLYKDQLRDPEERQVREIIVASESEAKDILIQLLQGADFSTLARERSRAQSAREGGDLGFISFGEKFEQFDKVVFSETLEVGQVSQIFKGSEGYYLVKVENIRGGKARALTEVWDDIKRTLTFLKQRQKIEEVVSQLSTNAKIEIYEGEVR